MPTQPPPKPPYIDWRLDAWKIGAILLFFILLAIGAFWDDAPFAGVWRVPADPVEYVDANGYDVLNGTRVNGVANGATNRETNDLANDDANGEIVGRAGATTPEIPPTPFGAGVLTPALTSTPTPVAPSPTATELPTADDTEIGPTAPILPGLDTLESPEENHENDENGEENGVSLEEENGPEIEPVNGIVNGEANNEITETTREPAIVDTEDPPAENDTREGRLPEEATPTATPPPAEVPDDETVDDDIGATPTATLPTAEVPNDEATDDETLTDATPTVATPTAVTPTAVTPTAVTPMVEVPNDEATDDATTDDETPADATSEPEIPTATLEPEAVEPTPVATLAAIELPLTLANVAPNSIATLGTVTRLEGTGSIGKRVEVRVQHINVAGAPGLLPVSEPEELVGSAAVDEEGHWRLAPDPPLRPGQNVISLRQVDETGVLDAVSSPVVVNVLAGGEEGPLSLVTPAIRFPGVGSHLETGTIAFRGTGLPGIQIRLYLNNRLAGETFVGTLEEWQIAPRDILRPGAYVARAAAVNPQGEIIAESAPVAFVVHEPPLGLREAPPGRSAVPLDVARVIPANVFGPAIFLNGTATPHSSVAVLLDGAPLIFANVHADGRWVLALDFFSRDQMPAFLTVTTDLGEQVLVNLGIRDGGALETPYAPVIVIPAADARLGLNPPVVAGLAQPGSRILIGIDGQAAAHLSVDAWGQWAYRPRTPLSTGEHIITAVALSPAGEPRGIPGTSIRVTVE